jgi:predicted ATP-binding protein involved in virulence
MRLVAVSVEKYRSIDVSRRLDVGQSTVLVGPNNEGKSNILRALIAGMTTLTGANVLGTDKKGVALVMIRGSAYRWNRDYPVGLQASEPEGESVIGFEFDLSEQEQIDFHKHTGSSLNGTLPIEIRFGNKEVYAKLRVRKPGKGAARLTAKTRKIAEFIRQRIEFKYIEAVRTAQSAERIIREILGTQLAALESRQEYQDALKTIAQIQQPVLDQLSQSVKQTLVQFMGDIQDVTVAVSESSRTKGLRACEIWVDDGTRTELQYKGDGVQSLAALGIMRYASEKEAAGKQLLIAIEEPESHLHPDAIHGLREVLYQLADRHQVIITTHCPLLVNRAQPSANILVVDNKAKPAKSIQQVREILGVRASDNLTNAELVLVVEGAEDQVALTSILRDITRQSGDWLGKAIGDGVLAVDPIGGAGNLAYKLGLYRSMVCPCVCFLDADGAAKRAIAAAKADGLLTDADLVMATCQGYSESEMEDLYDPEVYKQMLLNNYNVSTDHPKFRGAKPWSDRMAAVFASQGKVFADLEVMIKGQIAECVRLNPSSAVLSSRRGPFEALVRLLSDRLGRDTNLSSGK